MRVAVEALQDGVARDEGAYLASIATDKPVVVSAGGRTVVGVLEPVGQVPVIIEDDALIGGICPCSTP